MKIIYIIIIIILGLILVGTIIFLFYKNNSISGSKNNSGIVPNVLIENGYNANWYSNYDSTKMFYFPEELYSGKPLFAFPQDNSNPTIGIAFSGGGTRASCSTMGILQALNSKSLLDKSIISYMTANSGSTWILLPLFYQTTDSPITIEQILGEYVEPALLDFTTERTGPNFINTAVNARINPEIQSDWWNESIGNSYFLPSNLYDPTKNTKFITGYDLSSIQAVLNNQGSNYKGIVVRDNLPMPIVMCSLPISGVTTSGVDYFSYIPIDSSPVSSGFLLNTSTNISALPNNDPLKNYGGRVTSYAFSSNLVNTSTNAENNTRSISVDFTFPMWDPVNMSGTSSMAVGPQLLVLPDTIVIPGVDEVDIMLLQDYKIQTEYTSPSNISKKLVDGYVTDDLGIISLLVRKTQKIVCVVNLEFDALYSRANLAEGSYVAITSGEFQNYFGVVKGVTGSDVNLLLLGKNPLIVITDVTNLQSIDIHDFSNLFSSGYNLFDQSIIGYSDTIKGMIENYANSGIFYYQGTYKTNINSNFDLISYDVDILWYCLSPCPNFLASLTEQNRDIWNGIFNIPNVCTQGPIFNDCNLTNPLNAQCYSSCNLGAIDTAINAVNICSVTTAQAVGISGLTGWVTEQIIIPFINSPFGEKIPSPIPAPTIIPTVTPTPGTPVKHDRIPLLMQVLVPVINAKINNELAIKPDSYTFSIGKIPSIQSPPPIILSNENQCSGTCIAILLVLGSLKINNLILNRDSLTVSYQPNTIILNFNASSNVSLLDFKINFYAAVKGYDRPDPWNDPNIEPLGITTLDPLSATLNLTNFQLTVPVIYKNGAYTLNFTNSKKNDISAIIIDSSYNPDLGTWLQTNIVHFILSNPVTAAVALLLGAFTIPLIAAIPLFTDYIKDLINIDAIADLVTLLPDNIVSSLGPVELPIPCDGCILSCPTDPGSLFICSNHGNCNRNTGECVCTTGTGWEGNKCENCGTHYDNTDGKCTKCANHWIGAKCEICPPHWYGDNCNLCPPNRDGFCDKCASNWTGDNCDICPPNFEQSKCISCANHWTGPVCSQCPPNFEQTNCSTCANHWTGTNCDQCLPHFDVNCDQCATGWSGPDCTICTKICNPNIPCGGSDSCGGFCPSTTLYKANSSPLNPDKWSFSNQPGIIYRSMQAPTSAIVSTVLTSPNGTYIIFNGYINPYDLSNVTQIMQVYKFSPPPYLDPLPPNILLGDLFTFDQNNNTYISTRVPNIILFNVNKCGQS